jgi:DNA polymerase I-like protein with 3'-5' exonuclease and polymerase domains
MILQMHDQIVLEAPAAQAEEWRSRLVEAMEQPVAELGGTVFPTDSSIGERWSDL